MNRQLVALVLALCLAATVGAQEVRTALVVGNSNYQLFGNLANPQNDARDVGLALEALGFRVTTLLDATERELMNAIRDFGSELSRNKGVGLFYYAGHGIESEGKNYLIPVDADIRAQDEVRFSSIEMGFVLSKMESARNPTNIVILDACRDNPLPAEARSAGSRGLSIVEAPTGSLLVYATQPGNVAADGRGRNSPFTEAFLEHLATPDVDVELMLRMVRQSVMEATANQQVPWTNSSLTRSVVLARGSASAAQETVAGSTTTTTGGRADGVPEIIVTEYGALTVDTIMPGDLFFDGRFMTSMSAGAEVMLPRVEAGTYTVEIRYADRTETREVTVTGGQRARVRFDDRPEDAGRSPVRVPGRLTVGGEVESSLDGREEELEYYGYVDWYPLSVQRGQAVTVSLSSYDYDTYLLIRFPDGSEMTNDDSDGTDSAITFIPESTQDVRVGATSFYTGEIGSYVISVQPTTVETIGLGQSVSEYREGGDDLYLFTGRSGQTIRISLDSDDFDTTLDLEAPGGGSYYNDDYDDSLNSQLTYSFASAGDARILVGGYGNGSYTLRVEEVSALEFDQGHRLRNGDSLTGRLTAQSPVEDGSYYQLFTFEVGRGDRITLTMTSDTLDSYLRVIGPDGSTTEDDDGHGNRNARVSMSAPAGGLYEVYATTYWGQEEGVYTLAFQTRSGSQVTDVPDGELRVGGQVRGRLGGQEEVLEYYGYIDWYTLGVQRGSPVTIRHESGDFDAYLVVRLPDGTEYTNDDSDGTNSAVTIVPTESGTVRVGATSFFEDETGSYVLSAQSATIDRVRVGQTARGSTEDGDVLFRLTGQSGQVVRLIAVSEEFDTTLELTGPAEEYLYSDDYGNSRNAQLIYRFATNGDAMITVGGYGSGSFELVAEALQVSEFEPGHRLSPGDQVVAVLDEASLTMDGLPFQLFTLEGRRGDRITITMESATLDSYLRVVGPDGDVWEDDDGFGGSDAQISFSVAEAGVYEIFARTYWGDEAGVYSLTVDRRDASSIILQTSGSLTENDPTSAGGSYYDTYEFQVQQRGTVVIEMDAYDFDGYATLYDVSGAELAYDDDGGIGTDPRIEFELSRGRYSVQLSSFYDGDTGDYEVIIYRR